MNIRTITLIPAQEEFRLDDPEWSSHYNMGLGFRESTKNKIKSWWGQWSRTNNTLQEYAVEMNMLGFDVQPIVDYWFCEV